MWTSFIGRWGMISVSTNVYMESKDPFGQNRHCETTTKCSANTRDIEKKNCVIKKKKNKQKGQI